jgi:hypothetical protein
MYTQSQPAESSDSVCEEVDIEVAGNTERNREEELTP